MKINLSEKQKKSLVGFKICDNFEHLHKGIYMKFYNLKNNQISSVRFNRIHDDICIIGLTKHNQERVFYIDKYIIFYKPKINKEREFMENIYNNLKITKED